MDRDFIIDGTGRAVRAGDRVLVSQMSFTDNFGPATVEAVIDERLVGVLFDSGVRDEVLAIRMKREDDSETSGGLPLWSWR